MIVRRTLLACGLAAPLVAAGPSRPTLSVGPTDRASREGCLWLPGGAVFTCPPARARLIAVFRLREMDVAAVAFGADRPELSQDMLALVSADGTLLALEPYSCKNVKGRLFSTRAAMLADRRHITFERNAACHGEPRRPGFWRRETWTDYMLLSDMMLEDAPPRLVSPDTWQCALSVTRAVLRTMIPVKCRTVTPDLLRACRASAFL